MYTDQPDRFSATSSSRNQYIMVLVEVDGNYIDAEPMKNRSAGLMIKLPCIMGTFDGNRNHPTHYTSHGQ